MVRLIRTLHKKMHEMDIKDTWNIVIYSDLLREDAKKISSLNGRANKLQLRALKEKIAFFGTFFSNIPFFQRPLNSRGGGLGLIGPAIKRRTFFCGFPLGIQAPGEPREHRLGEVLQGRLKSKFIIILSCLIVLFCTQIP